MSTPEISPVPDTKIESKNSKLGLRRIKWALGKAAKTGVLLASATLPLGQYYSGDPMVAPRHVVDMITSDSPDKVPASIKQEIDHIAASPTDAEYIRVEASLDKYYTAVFNLKPSTDGDHDGFGGEVPDDFTPAEATEYWELVSKTGRPYFELCMKKAEEQGLHLVDYLPFENQLETATSVDKVMDILKGYMTELGIKIDMPTHTDIKDIGIGVKTMDQSAIDLAVLKRAAANAMGAFSYVPKEVYDYADIQSLRIVQSLGSVDNKVVGKFAPAGIENSISGVLYLSYDDMVKAGFELPMHELSHRLDYKMSGSTIAAMNDDEYSSLNGTDFKYGDKESNIENSATDLYSATNVLEDKAKMMEVMVNGLDADLLYSDKPAVRNKYRLLLTRLEQHIPGYAKYLLSVVAHNKPEPMQFEK